MSGTDTLEGHKSAARTWFEFKLLRREKKNGRTKRNDEKEPRTPYQLHSAVLLAVPFGCGWAALCSEQAQAVDFMAAASRSAPDRSSAPIEEVW